LEYALIGAEDHAELAGRIENVFEIDKAMPLLGGIVNRMVGTGRILDADVILQIIARDIVIEMTDRAGVFDRPARCRRRG